MRVLVTGGSGFIGSHVVDKLRARGYEPVIYDLRPSPWHSDPDHPVDTVLGSITDREALERALHSCDAVAHLAAVADVNDVHASPEDAERVNARGTVTVLEAARRAGVKRIVYASTIWVYSDCEPEAVDEETLLPAPSHLYTSTKLAGELGWTAATPFSEGVRRYVEWRREQEAQAAAHEAEAVIPAGEPDAEARPRQVLIISADIGEGHDLPARAVAREFHDEDPDAQVSIVNGLPAMGWILTKVLRENSAFMFQWLPWLFDFQYTLLMYFAPTRWFSRRLMTALGRRGLMRLIRAHDPDLIVSTYPGVTAVLGELRRRGRLDVPCYSSITDLAGLQFWAHPGIDLHFVTHPESVEEVEQIAGPGSARR